MKVNVVNSEEYVTLKDEPWWNVNALVFKNSCHDGSSNPYLKIVDELVVSTYVKFTKDGKYLLITKWWSYDDDVCDFFRRLSCCSDGS